MINQIWEQKSRFWHAIKSQEEGGKGEMTHDCYQVMLKLNHFNNTTFLQIIKFDCHDKVIVECLIKLIPTFTWRASRINQLLLNITRNLSKLIFLYLINEWQIQLNSVSHFGFGLF